MLCELGLGSVATPCVALSPATGPARSSNRRPTPAAAGSEFRGAGRVLEALGARGEKRSWLVAEALVAVLEIGGGDGCGAAVPPQEALAARLQNAHGSCDVSQAFMATALGQRLLPPSVVPVGGCGCSGEVSDVDFRKLLSEWLASGQARAALHSLRPCISSPAAGCAPPALAAAAAAPSRRTDVAGGVRAGGGCNDPSVRPWRAKFDDSLPRYR
eukprot:SAG11_NODE_3329_length_2521_cov_1.265483_2_plen_215_part_00